MSVADDRLSGLSVEERNLLTSLPYRIGLYISYSDVTGGWEAQERENQALTSILQEFTQDHFKSEFIRLLLIDTLGARDEWLTWSRSIWDVPAQISSLRPMLEKLMGHDGVDLFAKVMVDIALTVAMAFREQADQMDVARDGDAGLSAIRQIIAKLMGGDRKRGEILDHSHISAQEKEALMRLSVALGYRAL